MTDVASGSAESAGAAMADSMSTPGVEIPTNGYTKPPSTGKPASSALKELMSVSDDTPAPSKQEPKAKSPVPAPDAEGVATEAAPAGGIVRAKHGESELEIPEDAVFKFKVEGKEVEVTYKDLQRNYQGKVPWERRYKETKDLERQVKEQQAISQAEINRVKAEKAEETSFIAKIMDTVQKDPFDALVRIAIRQGKNPVEFIPQYIQQAQKTIEHISEMDENQFQLLLKQKKLDYDTEIFKGKQSEIESKKKQEEELTELQAYIDKRIVDFKITQEEFDASQETFQQAVKDGFDASKLTPKQIADIITGYVVQFQRPEGRITNIISEHAPELVSDKRFIQELRHHISDAKGNILPDISDDDIAQIVKGFIGDDTSTPASAAKKTEEAVLGASPTKDSSRNSPTPATFRKTPRKKDETRTIASSGDEDDPLSMDDIIKGYRRK